jgi:cyclohexyl-isocyanide hydratase
MALQFGILIFPQIQLLDLAGPYEVFAALPDVSVNLIWKNTISVSSSSGIPIAPTVTFESCPALDLLCVPGGGGINALLEDQETLTFIHEQAAHARYVTSVCTGSIVLGAAGLLKGRKATSHWNTHDLLSYVGAIPTPGRVVRDGNLITAGGATSGIDFGLNVAADLFGDDKAQSIQLALEYAPAPPFDSGTPETATAKVLAATKQRMSKSRAAREAILKRL